MTPPTSIAKSNEEIIKRSATNSDDEAELKMPLWKANMWFSVIWFMMLFDLMDRYALSATLPMIKKTYQLTDAQSGMLASVFGFSIAFFVIPASIIAHKWSRRKVCSIMVALWSLASLGTGYAKGYFPLLAARFGVGVGEAGYVPVGYALISAWYPKSKRGLMMGWLYSASQVGATIGLMVAGWLTVTYGWQACFGILAVPGLILAAIGWFMPDFKNEVKTRVEEVEQAGPKGAANTTNVLKLGVKDALIYTLKSPAILCSFLITGFLMIGTTSMSIWGVTLFTRTYGMKLNEAANFMGLIGVLACTLPILLGWMGDKLVKNNKKGRLTSIMIIISGFLLAILLFTQNSFHAKSLVVAFLGFGLAKAFVISAVSNINSVTQDLLPPYYRSVANMFIPMANQGIGGTFGPILCGLLSDSFGISMALALCATITFVLVMLFTIACRVFYAKDSAKLESMGKFELERA